MPQFRYLVSTLPGWPDVGVAIAASRCGAVGILNLENVSDVQAAESAVARLRRYRRGPIGIKLDSNSSTLLPDEIAGKFVLGFDLAILTCGEPERLSRLLRLVRSAGLQVLLESTSDEQAALGARLGVDGLVAKGNEAGGRVGEETTFILLQRLLKEFRLPVWAQGGIGLHTVGACFAAGAAGVLLDAQLALASDSSLPTKARALIERMQGDETLCLGAALGDRCRIYKRPGMAAADDLQRLERELAEAPSLEGAQERWRAAIESRVGWRQPESSVMPLGQDAAFAKPLAQKFHTTAGIVEGLHQAAQDHIQAARTLLPLDRGSALARSHHTEYPILQGPMTRVSDSAAFAAAVAEGGALPFLALALMRAPQVRTLLAETKKLVGDRPWGIGILGFVPLDLRTEQLEVVREFRPPYAIIAGGRPDQAANLEREGTATYLHVPAPGLLQVFLEGGARRFIFEGRECGGHVGPRSSFVLWESMIDVLLQAVASGIPAGELHVVFAGGIHDARSAAMVSVMAAPLAAKGVRIGVLMGTGYLFTKEAVEANAIVAGFQREAIACKSTVLLDSGPGHSTRCAATPFFQVFEDAKRKLVAQGKSSEDVREALENLNLGRLRIASKGIARDPQAPTDRPSYINLTAEQQKVEGMYMIGQLAALRDEVCTIRDLHENVAAEGSRLLHALVPPEELRKEPADLPASKPADIAVVGMSCLLPGAQDVKTFWKNVLTRFDAVRDIPPDRFDADLYFDADKKAHDKIYAKRGGFLDDVAFDPMRYGIPPSALQSIDPFQLLSLEGVHQALQDADYLEREFPRERTSVIFGLSGGLGDLGLKYGVRSLLPLYFGEVPAEAGGQLPEWTEDSFAGLLLNVAPGRVANRFNLGGVNYAVDAACASSLAAVQLAVRELESGSSDMVIVGGVDTTQNPFGYLCFAKSQALSARGYCGTFDESTDGIAIGEGLAMLVLKRLADAERDGDRIYAVLKSVAGSSDGRGKGLTAPRPEGQMLALERAYRAAGISPETIGLVEAHGTGTVAGDAAEIDSLSQIYKAAGAVPASCAIGSVKTMIGHTKAAAGVVGLMKVALSLYHKTLPPTLHVKKPNARLREPECPFYVNTESSPWMARSSSVPRRASVSSFGFGGTNFHAVVEEYQGEFQPAAKANVEEWPSELFYWSAATGAEIGTSLQSVENLLRGGSTVPLRDLAASVCAASQTVAEPLFRLAIVASSAQDLLSKIESAKQAISSGSSVAKGARGVYLGTGRAATPKLAFLFPGQGSQHPGMLRDIALEFPEIRTALETANHIPNFEFPQPLSSYVYPPPAFTPAEEEAQMNAITDTAVAQPALGAVEAGMVRLLDRLGVRAELSAGHSYGEYVALWAAGVWSDELLFEISAARGRFIKDSTGENPGSMAAVNATRSQVEEALNGVPKVWLANFNAPKQTIIAGGAEDLRQAMATLSQKGLTSRAIPVACAFHTPLMEAARDRFGEFLAQKTFAAPRFEVFSNSLAAAYPKEPAEIAALLREHLVRPVEFVREIEAMYDNGARIFLEVGPKGVLTGLARRILADKDKDKDVVTIATDSGEVHGITQLQQALGQIAVAGIPVKIAELFRGRVSRVLPLSELEHAKPPAPSAWVLTGGAIRPRKELSAPQKGQDRVAQTVTQKDTPKKSPAEEKTAAPRAALPEPAPKPSALPARPAELRPPLAQIPAIPRQEAPPMRLRPSEAVSPAPQPAALPPAPANGPDAVVIQFQRLMSQFLQTQESVMRTYLNARTESPAYEAMAPSAILPDISFATAEALPTPVIRSEGIRKSIPEAIQPPLISQPAPPIAQPAPPAAPLVEAASVAAPAQARDVAAELIDIVSTRTGYPPEMLDLDANIEADLGIDSIKRVEILSAFQKICSPQEQARIQSTMERLTKRKTLRELAGALSEALGEAVQAASPAKTPQVVGETAAPAQRDFTAELIEIVSTRTGYPPEMLDLDANIEADLGIDSIKRVEILSAFQKICSPQEQARIQSTMERLTKRKTLRELAGALSEALGEAVQAASPAKTPQVVGETAAPAQRDFTAELIEIVSTRTGYPPEMLDLDANIEADLGIDSIKRVEILSAFQKICSPQEQARIQSTMERLTKRKTLREVSGALSEALAAEGSAAPRQADSKPANKPSTATAAVSGADADVPRFSFQVVNAPLPAAPSRAYPNRVCVITDDESGIAEHLAKSLRGSGELPVLLRQRAASSSLPADTYPVDLANPREVETVLDEIRRRYGSIGALAHLRCMKPGQPYADMSMEQWRTHVQLEIKSLYALAKFAQPDLTARGREQGAVLAVVTGMGGSFAIQPAENLMPSHAGAAAFLKTYSIETAGVLCKSIDLDPSEPAAVLADRVRLELGVGGETHQEIGYFDGRRVTIATQFAPLGNGLGESATPILDRDSVVLLTGGARGITAEIAFSLATRFQPTLILAGGSPAPAEAESPATTGKSDPQELKAALTAQLRSQRPVVRPADVEAEYQRLMKRREIQRNLERLRSAGARVEYRALDVRDETAFGGLIDDIYRRYQRLDSVIHGAGLIEDRWIQDKAPDSFDRVVHTKADSAFVLSRKLRPESLKSLVLMSSVTAAFGNAGQCDYAAANGVLNGLAAWLSARWPGRVVAMNWGPWDQLGMVSEAVREQFLARGVQLIPPSGGADAVLLELRFGGRSEPVVALGRGPWAKTALQPIRPAREAEAVLVGPGVKK